MSVKISQLKKTALVSALMLEISMGVDAATIHVDGVTCNLNDAITAANTDMVTGGCVTGDGGDVLELPVEGNIDLSAALPTINSDVTLNCNGTRIRRFQAGSDFPILQNDFADLVVNDCIISAGSTTSQNANSGGGITSSYGNLSINRSEITSNEGGGIATYNTNVTITESVISDNFGLQNANRLAAGISLQGGTHLIDRSTVSGNSTYGNAKGGGVFVTNSYFYSSSLTVLNSTISNNFSSSGGGGIHQEEYFNYIMGGSANLNLTQVTLVQNSTGQNGGGVFNEDGQINLNQSIISGNSANLVNEILSTSYTVNVDNFNLIGLNGQASVVGVTLGGSDAVISETSLSAVMDTALSDNGGLTPTHALTPTSPAVDFVMSGACASATDQTGRMRGLECDVGAIEYNDVIFADNFEPDV